MRGLRSKLALALSIATGIALLSFQNCSGSSGSDGSAAAQAQTTVKGMVMFPAATLLAPSGTTQLIPSGSSGTVTYSLVSGTGTLGATGIYTAPATATDALIKAVDANGNSAYSFIKVATSSSLLLFPNALTIGVNELYPISAMGGTPPYTYSVSPSTAGMIDPLTGYFTAGASATQAIISATDSAGASSSMQVNISALLAQPVAGIFAPNPVAVSSSTTFFVSGNVLPFSLSVISGSATASGMVLTTGSSSSIIQVRLSDSAGDAMTAVLTSQSSSSGGGGTGGGTTGGMVTKTVTITGNVADVNIASVLSNPTVPVAVTVNVSAGAIVYSTSTSHAAIVSGTLPAGSTLTIVNNGQINGKGGDGGAGGNEDSAPGYNGGAGGPAISVTMAATITNNGGIYGGGGGGGGAGTSRSSGFIHGGNGGGGGAGGGNGGINGYGNGAGHGQPGTYGDYAGHGGPGGAVGVTYYGGNGGGWAQPGTAVTHTWNGGIYAHGADGSPGAAGAAVNRNGNSVTVSGGSVVGAVN